MCETLMIIMQPYPSQPTPPNWHTPFDKGDLITCTVFSANLKPTYMSLPSHTSWSSTPCPTHSPSTLQNQVYQTMWFLPEAVVVLSHVSVLLSQDTCMYQTTWPHSTNHLQFHSTKGHHDTLYGSNTSPLNSKVFAIFPPSATTPATHWSGS